MFKLDFTTHSVVVTCALCPSWRELRATREAAWSVARAHESSVHRAGETSPHFQQLKA